MGCVPVSPAMRELLQELERWPDVDIESLRKTHEWAQALAWGWAMDSGEVTGTGFAHLGEPPRGIVTD